MRLRLGLRPGSAGGAYSAPPDSLAGFGKGKGLRKGEELGKGLGRKGGGQRKEGEREESKGKKGGKGRSNPSRTKILATVFSNGVWA